MAVRSRFVDDFVTSPAIVPTRSPISVRRKDELAGEILPGKYFAKQRTLLIDAQEFRSKDLYRNYPPNFHNENKRFIFNSIYPQKKYSPAEEKSLLISRWYPISPRLSRSSPWNTEIHVRHDVFTYQPPATHRAVEWHLNFANDVLFGFYAGDLLAQDELQVLECPELAALREYLVHAHGSVNARTVEIDPTRNQKLPTPILISNVDRVIHLDTRRIYGNAFARASKEDLREALHFLPAPQRINLIAIEAPKYGHGVYTREQIEFVLMTAYSGFKAARIAARKTRTLNRNAHSLYSDVPLRTIIHTGWWGCGAYGNNRQMMILTQILAAHWARIDALYFHVINHDFDADIAQARATAAALLSETNLENLIERIHQLGLKWEQSNNT